LTVCGTNDGRSPLKTLGFLRLRGQDMHPRGGPKSYFNNLRVWGEKTEREEHAKLGRPRADIARN
jgi:hypothetical protein